MLPSLSAWQTSSAYFLARVWISGNCRAPGYFTGASKTKPLGIRCSKVLRFSLGRHRLLVKQGGRATHSIVAGRCVQERHRRWRTGRRAGIVGTTAAISLTTTTSYHCRVKASLRYAGLFNFASERMGHAGFASLRIVVDYSPKQVRVAFLSLFSSKLSDCSAYSRSSRVCNT